jgi:hypothetical protein
VRDQVLRYSRRMRLFGRASKPPEGDITSIAAAWKVAVDQHGSLIASHINERLSPESITLAGERVLQIEEAAVRSADPLHHLRSSILDATDLWICSEAIDDEIWSDSPDLGRALEQVLRREELTRCATPFDGFGGVGSTTAYCIGRILARALRLYTSSNYGDRADHDWCAWYVDNAYTTLSHLFFRVAERAASKLTATDDELYAEWKESLARARSRALDEPIGQTIYPIPPRGLTW